MDTKEFQNSFDTFLDEKVSRLQKSHKLAIAATTALLPMILFYFFVYAPKSTEIVTLQKAVTTLESELKTVKVKAGKLDEQQAMMKEMEEKFMEASVVMPDNKEIPSLLTNISSQGTGSGLDLLSFTPGDEIPKEFYAEIPVSLSVKGTYHNLGYFLDTISKLPRIVNVANLSISTPTMEEGEMMLSTKLSLVTYKFIEPAKGQKGRAK